MSQLSSAKKIALSFAVVIIIGSLLLSLPISQTATSDATYFDHLFIAVSAVCVTGLWVESIFDTYNTFGQIIMLMLIQIGGLGLMTFISLIYFRIGQNVRIRDQVAVSGALNNSSLNDIANWLGKIFRYTFIIEGLGALLFGTYFIPEYGLGRGTFLSIFMAVSAFCNLGFDPLGNSSMIGLQTQPVVNWTIISLVILGGIGFSVWFDVASQMKKFDRSRPKVALKNAFRQLRPHTKLALKMTILLITLGTFLFLAFEWNNSDTIGKMSIGDKFMTAVFQTVTMRTGFGFASIDYTLAHPVSILIFVVTMFIGGSPGGTAGGLKTTTFALVLMMAIAEIRQKEFINFDKHTIPAKLLRQAFVIFLLYNTLLIIGSGLILTFDPQVDFLYVLFEAISAFATVGVTANLTPLSMASQIILMALMFIGRIGPMTMFLSLLPSKNNKKRDIKYTNTNILIG